MSSTATSFAPAGVTPAERLEVLVEELAELTGQRNAIDGRVVAIVAEIDRDGLCGMTGATSVPAWVAWKTGMSPANAETITAVAQRVEEFPRLVAGMAAGRFSLDLVGVIAKRAAAGSDAHYEELAASATVSQLRFAIQLEPRPDPQRRSEPRRSISKTEGQEHATWRITLPPVEAATFDAALDSYRDGLIAEWKREHPDHDDTEGADSPGRAPMPTLVDGFMSLVQAGWDAEAAARPHGQRTTVIVHLDVEPSIGSQRKGTLLNYGHCGDERCDATCVAWFQRDGRVIGAGRATRTVSRRLRRALEHRDHTCVVPGCAATRGLHAHHLRHWEDGGPTDLDNLVLLCPYHHRLHHRGGLTLTGDAHHLLVTDEQGQRLHPVSLARPPTTPPPEVPPYPGPTGERAQWWWYTPYEPQPPPTTN
jgi:hypothetical protein